MDDKNRILMEVIKELHTTLMLGVRYQDFDRTLLDRGVGREYVHFGRFEEIKSGDLVMGTTGHTSDFTIGWVDEVLGHSHCMIREIGSDRLCNYSNESFVKIKGLKPEQLWEQEYKEFEKKLIKAFVRGGDWEHRYGGLEFGEDRKNRTATISIRKRWGNPDYHPFSFTMKWNKRTSIKKILEEMRQAGYGTREFEKIEKSEV